MTHDSQTEPQAAVLARCGGVGLREAFEDVWNKFRINTLAAVPDTDLKVRADAAALYLDLFSSFRELDRIAQQIPKNLLDSLGICKYRLGSIRDLRHDGDASRRCRGLNRIHGRTDDGAGVRPLGPNFEFARDDLGDVEQIVHQLHLRSRISLDHVDCFLSLAPIQPSTLKEIAPSEDGGQRRPQFVRKGCQKLILHLAGSLELFIRSL